MTATANDVVGVTWSSSAEFRASGDGTLSLDQAPVGGSYAGANPMGLFQFMAPDDPRPLGFGAPLSGTSVVRLEAKVDGRTVATATATRRSPEAVGVTTRKLTVPADGVYGVLYRPKDTTTRMPALLVFGGSEGGLSYPVQVKAALLAAHGYPTLALAYFDAPGLPKDLAAIPLEYFRKALTVLRAQPGVDTDHLLVTGASWGGEGSLLVAATYPDLVNGVIAEVPSRTAARAGMTETRPRAMTHAARNFHQSGPPVASSRGGRPVAPGSRYPSMVHAARHPLPVVVVAAPASPSSARAHHIAVNGGVLLCHGSGLEARGVRAATLEVRALLAAKDAGDAGRERARVLGGNE